MISKIQTIRKIYSLFKDEVKIDDWLSNLNYSEAFVVCIGAGPWKIARRRTIQQMALEKLINKDLSELEAPIDWYPLLWQNNILTNLIQTFKSNKLSMNEFCDIIIKNVNAQFSTSRFTLYHACGVPKGCKVLSLYCRDKLEIDSFPIDRHVRKFLKENNLPINENDMIELCKEANLNPREVACGIVKSFGAVKNHKW